MGSFGEDLQKLRNDTVFEYYGAILIIGLIIAVILFAVSYGVNYLITMYNWTTSFEILIVIFFIIFVIFQLFGADKQENAIVKYAKIIGVAIIAGLFVSAILWVMGAFILALGFWIPMIVYWIAGILLINSTTIPKPSTYYGPRD